MTSVGRVLIIGSRASGLAARLAVKGYACDSADHLKDLAATPRGKPDVIVLATTRRTAQAALKTLRATPAYTSVPVLLDGSGGLAPALQGLDVDGVAQSLEELDHQIAASLRARKLTEREALVRRRLELLLDITRATSESLPFDALSGRATARLREALGCEHVALLFLEGTGPRKAFLIDDRSRTPVDLAVTPTLRHALETQDAIHGDGAWAFGFPGQHEGVAAVVLRREAPFEQEERDFLNAVGIALAHALEQDRAQKSVALLRESLEAAYVDRYRELLQANQRLQAVDRKKNELLAVLSHDLRAPLNVLLGHSWLLLNDKALEASLRPSAEAIQRTGKKALELVESLLAQSRGEGGHVALFTRTMDVAETCQDSVRDLQILARERAIQLRVEAPMSLMVLGDEQKIRQVLQNLITNALKHAKGASSVVVRARYKTRPDGDVALVEVQDDGKVADPNDLLLAFDRAQGLGLGICRDYVERHGGEIWPKPPPRAAPSLPSRCR